jgi:DNA-binding response OmpR family regulator/putative methionine-R-sulfoxide reductase with GAF domain
MSGELILIIDDSREIVKHLTEHVLPVFGYKTTYAYDGQSGLTRIREVKPDLVMLDFNLPEMTGLDVLQQMAQESLSTPVILMTGYGSELSAIESFRLGAKDYLIKPFTVDEVVETIDRALVEVRLLHDKAELADQLRRIKAEMNRQTHEMNTLFKIGKAITSLLSVEEVLERVLEAARYLTDAEESYIRLLNPHGEEMTTYAGSGLPDETTLDRFAPPDCSYLQEVIGQGRPFRQSSSNIEPKSGLHPLLCVPLKLSSVVMGALEVRNRASLRSFSRRDEFLLSFLADYAAIALDNARLLQAADQTLARKVDELHTLIDITHTITSTLDLDEVIHLAIKQVHESWQVEAASLWWLDPQRQTLRVLSNAGTPQDILFRMEVPLGQGFVGTVAQTGQWIYSNDVDNHTLHYRSIDTRTGFKTHSILCVPLKFRGKVVGALQLVNKRDTDFDEQDIERALSFAAAIAIAMTNAISFDKSETLTQP